MSSEGDPNFLVIGAENGDDMCVCTCTSGNAGGIMPRDQVLTEFETRWEGYNMGLLLPDNNF